MVYLAEILVRKGDRQEATRLLRGAILRAQKFGLKEVVKGAERLLKVVDDSR